MRYGLYGFTEPNLYGDGGECKTLYVGTVRQCMDHAASIVPRYQGWRLNLTSIADAWETMEKENLDYVWLDEKSEYFFVEKLNS